jgi:hypothetical protein
MSHDGGGMARGGFRFLKTILINSCCCHSLSHPLLLCCFLSPVSKGERERGSNEEEDEGGDGERETGGREEDQRVRVILATVMNPANLLIHSSLI